MKSGEPKRNTAEPGESGIISARMDSAELV